MILIRWKSDGILNIAISKLVSSVQFNVGKNLSIRFNHQMLPQRTSSVKMRTCPVKISSGTLSITDWTILLRRRNVSHWSTIAKSLFREPRTFVRLSVLRATRVVLSQFTITTICINSCKLQEKKEMQNTGSA